MQKRYTIVICGAGIAGIATAYYLLKTDKNIEVILIDKNQPLSFTTSKSGENYRSYWPQDSMRHFISDSINLMKELRKEYGNDSFDMVNSGYNFISHDSENQIFGTNPSDDAEEFIEELTTTSDIQHKYPYLDKNVKKLVRIKNAGKIDVYALGSLLLHKARHMGLKQEEGEIVSIEKKDSKFNISLDSERIIKADKIVIAAGPFINHMAKMLGFQFPISNTLQRKFIIPDPENIIPKDMPFTIYADPQYLDWSKEEAEFFASDEKFNWLLQKFPGGLHIKPEKEGIKLGWAFQTKQTEPVWHTPEFDFFPQVVLKGASRFIPKLAAYESKIPTPLIEYAGYYTRTNNNLPLIGPTEVNNVFVIGALAGYGTMGACAAGKLCSSYVLGLSKIPNYAENFHPLNTSASYVSDVLGTNNDGQL